MRFYLSYILRTYILIDTGRTLVFIFCSGISIRYRNARSKSGLLSWTYPPDGVSRAFATWRFVVRILPVPTIGFSWLENMA